MSLLRSARRPDGQVDWQRQKRRSAALWGILIVGLATLMLFEDGVHRAPRKLFFAAMVIGVFLVVAVVTHQLSKVVGENVAAVIGAMVLLGAALAFVLWVMANWGGG